MVIGALILMPMGLFGPKTGTNNAISSGAVFGVRGRIVGSFLSLLTAIAFYSISVWVSGDALVGALNRLAGVPDNDLVRAITYAILCALVLVVVVYGYQFMLLVNKIVVSPTRCSCSSGSSPTPASSTRATRLRPAPTPSVRSGRPSCCRRSS